MSACEECWTEAAWRARIRGGHTADHYRDLLAENESKHTPDPATPTRAETPADRQESDQ